MRWLFIVKSDEGWSEVPVYLTCSLAEKDYSFKNYQPIRKFNSFLFSGRKKTNLDPYGRIN